MAGMSQDLVLRLLGDASSATRALHEAAAAADVTVSAYRKAEREQAKQNKAAETAAAAQAKAAAEQKRIQEELAAAQAAAAASVGRGMLVAGAAMAAGLGLSIKAAIDWESAWAGVVKVVDGTPAQMAVLEKQLRSLTSVLPASHQEIAAVAAAAGQLGIQRENIAGFTKTMIELGVSTNISAEQGAMSMARFLNIMGDGQDKVSNLGSSIVYLGNNFATTESEILDMTMRLAGAGKTAGLTSADVMGIAAALSSVGIEAEAGGTAFSKIMINIAQAVSDGGDQLSEFSAVAGMSADAFAKQWSTNPAQAITAFVQGLGNIQKAGGDVFGTLESLGITEVRMRDALLRAASAGDVMSRAITGSNEAYRENTALQNEAATRFATTASQIQLLGNGFVEAGIGIGQTFLPALQLGVDVVKTIVDGFNALPGPVRAGIAVMLGLGTAVLLAGGAALVLGPRLAALSAQFATLAGSSGAATAMIGRAGLAMMGPWGAAIAAVIGGLTLVTGLFSSGGPAVQDYEGYVQQLTDAFRESSGAMDENVRKVAATKVAQGELASVAKDAGLNLSTVTDAVLGNTDAYEKIIKTLKDYRKEAEGMTYIDDLSKKSALEDIDKAITQFEDLAGATGKAKQEAKNYAEASSGSASAMGDQADAAKSAAGAQGEYAGAQEAAAKAAQSTKDAVDSLKQSFDRLTGAQVDINNATADMTLGLADMAKTLRDNGNSFDASTEAGAKNVKMLSDMRSKAIDVITATYQQTGSMEAAQAAYTAQRQSIIDVMVAAGMAQDQAAALVDSILKMPDESEIDVKLTGAGKAQQALEDLGATAYETASGTYQVKIDALTADARAQLESLGFQIVQMPDGSFMVTALTTDAQTALDGVLQKAGVVDQQAPTVTPSAPTAGSTQLSLESVTLAAQIADNQNPTLPTTAPGAVGAKADLDNVTSAAGRVPGLKQVQVDAETGVAYGRLTGIQEALAGIKDKSVTVTTYHKTVVFGNDIMFPTTQANGGYVNAADGRSPMFAPGGSNILWAEPETGGEWYLPDSAAKRPRSLGLARDMLNSWGYAMVPHGQLQTAQQQPAINVHVGGGDQQITGNLYLSSGEFLGTVQGVVKSALSDASRRAGSVTR